MGRGRKTDKIELPIPEEMNKLVQNLKEILSSDFTDSEIYVVLRDCQMNPDEAVQKLLSQDKFHEVKSKRERRKEMKEAQESKVHCSNISGVIIGVESNVGLAPSHGIHNEVGKDANMREIAFEASLIASSSCLSNAMITRNEQPTCDGKIVGAVGTISSSEELSGGFQPAFIEGPTPSGYSSLAEVVRLGRSRATGSHMVDVSYTINDKDSVSLAGEFCQKSQSEEVQVSEHDATSKNHCLNFAESDSSFNGEEGTDKVEGASARGNDDMAFHNLHRQANDHHEAVSGSLNNGISVTALSLEQLNLGKEEKEVPSLSKDTCTLVLPKCVQALDVDCSHLSFGTYNSGRFSPVKSNLEKASSNKHGKLGFFADPLYGELSGASLTTDKNHEFPFSSQPELSKQNIHETGGYGCKNSKLAPDSILKNTENYSSPWSAVISPPSREFHPFHGDQRAGATQTPSAVDESVKDSDIVYYLGRRQSNTKLCSDIVSCSGSSIIPTEILDSGAFALPKAFTPALPNTANHVIPQHLSAHPYSQASSLQQSYQDSTCFHESLADVKPNLQKLEGVASRFNLPPCAKISAQAKFSNSILANLSTIPNQSTIGYNDLLGSRYNEANNMAMLQQNDNGYGLGSRTLATVPCDAYYNRLARGQSLSANPPSTRDNKYYNLNGQDEQLSAYRQGVPDNGYLNIQRQAQLLSMYQQGIPDERYNRQVLDRLQQGLPSSGYRNLPGQSYAALHSRDVALHPRDAYGALHYPQGNSAALQQILDDVPPPNAQGSNKLLMNWQNFY